MTFLYHKQVDEIMPGVFQLQNVDKTNSPMKYTGVRVLEINAGALWHEKLVDLEAGVVVLTGKVRVKAENISSTEVLGTRESVFDRIPTDTVYVGCGQSYEVEAVNKAKILVGYSPTQTMLQNRIIHADVSQIEHRGKYNNRRLVQNILPDSLPFADKLLLVEVYTNSANWSSYPPHRHDHDNYPEETLLEEIYYHEVSGEEGFVFQHVYTDDLEIDETMTVSNGDVVIVPKGYHPVSVPDGYDGYYLNIMAGPIREWHFHNDPRYEWIINRQ